MLIWFLAKNIPVKQKKDTAYEMLPFRSKQIIMFYSWLKMIRFVRLAIAVPLSGTRSDEGSEALPYNGVYFGKFCALKQTAVN